jgi:aromatic ring-opening dioxygenase catalytic subunit (LigB family)
MGTIVGAFAMSHVVFEPEKAPAKAARVWAGMREIARRIGALTPDLLVIATNDHLNNFTLALQAPFIVGVADEYTPLGDMDIPRTAFPGDRAFADGFAHFAAGAGFDVARAEEIAPDHGFAFPNLVVNPGGRIPVVPFYINVANDMPPTPARVWALGGVMQQFVARERPAAERVVVLGAGGLSHWLCEPEQGRVNEAFDRMVIGKIVSGRARDLAALTSEQIRRDAGRSGLEVMHWIFAAATVPQASGQEIFYEPMPEWITGMGGIALTP